jgi:hypothetical protein
VRRSGRRNHSDARTRAMKAGAAQTIQES